MERQDQHIEYATYVLTTEGGQQVVAVAPVGVEISILDPGDPVQQIQEVEADHTVVAELQRLAVTNDIPAVMLKSIEKNTTE